MEKLPILLLGVGQSLRSDDGVGIRAVRLWQEAHPNDANRITADTAEIPGLGLLTLIQEFQTAVIVDAVRSGALPGTIHTILEDQIASFTPDSKSAHGWGLAETLILGRKLYDETDFPHITLIGMEIGEIALGDHLSSPVQNALPKLVAAIQAEIVWAISNHEKSI